MKTIQLVLHKLGEDISREIKPNTCHQSSFTLMSSSRARKLMSNRYTTLIILQLILLKALPTLTFEKLDYSIGMCWLNRLLNWYLSLWGGSFYQGEYKYLREELLQKLYLCVLYSFFFLWPVFPTGFLPIKVFNETIIIAHLVPLWSS